MVQEVETYKAEDEEHKKKAACVAHVVGVVLERVLGVHLLVVLHILGLVHLCLVHHLLDLLFAQLALVVGDGDPVLLAGGLFP